MITSTATRHHHRGHDHAHETMITATMTHEEDVLPWGHAHGPEPEELAGPGGWRRGLSAIVAVGLRPCSGAIIVLVFALAQGLFWAGVASTFVMGLGTAITSPPSPRCGRRQGRSASDLPRRSPATAL